MSSWAAQTPFTTSVPSALNTLTDLSWLRALLLAVAAIVLLLLPARMLATTVTSASGRHSAERGFRLTGRNRNRYLDDPAPTTATPHRVALGTAAIATGAGILMFAHPVHGEPAYLRLYTASVVAMLMVNLAAAIVPALVLRRRGAPIDVRVAPRYLTAIVGAALLSRALSLEPALLFGLVLAVGFGDAEGREEQHAGIAARGRLALARIGALLVLGLAGWAASTAIGDPSGAWTAFSAEVANITTVTAIGSAVILLVPVGRLSGRALLSWSRTVWFATSVLALSVLFALFSPVLDVWQGGRQAVLLAVSAGVFGAIGISTWLWRRFVSGQL